MTEEVCKRRFKIVNASIHEVNKYHNQLVGGLITLEEYITKALYIYNKSELLQCKNRLKEFSERL